MKNILLLIAICCILNFEVKAQNEVDTSKVVRLDEIEEADMPMYPGGMNALANLLGKNIKYPKAAERYGAEGKVIIAFAILRTGELSNFRVLKSAYIPIENEEPNRKLAYESLDNEALRLMKLSPNWTPAKFKGKPVKLETMMVPIQFQLP